MNVSAHPDPFSPLVLGPLTLANRLIKTATYEGMTPGGVPSPSLVRHHRELAEGGVGMTTVAYCAVHDEGRTFAEQLAMTPQAIPGLTEVAKAVHDAGGKVAIQLGHCGGFSKHRAGGRRAALGPSARFNAYGVSMGMPWIRAMNAADLARVKLAFVDAARHARDAGYDAVELHLGHGYLLSQFISPLTNWRKDAYGGSVEARAAYPAEIVAAVVEAIGRDVAVLAKVNVHDGVPGGLVPEDAAKVAVILARAGLHGLVTSGGFTDRSAFFLLRGGRPLAEMAAVQKTLLERVAMRGFGRVLVKEVPYEPTFFLDAAKHVREVVRVPTILVGGIASRADLDRVMAAGFDGAALGRALLHDPNFVQRLREESGQPGSSGAVSPCTHCNRCVVAMDEPGGVACVLVPAQLARRAAEVEAFGAKKLTA